MGKEITERQKDCLAAIRDSIRLKGATLSEIATKLQTDNRSALDIINVLIKRGLVTKRGFEYWPPTSESWQSFLSGSGSGLADREQGKE